jgi:DASH complex subunit DAM1
MCYEFLVRPGIMSKKLVLSVGACTIVVFVVLFDVVKATIRGSVTEQERETQVRCSTSSAIGARVLPFHISGDPMARVPPTTPLRRTSHASLYALARSAGPIEAPADTSAPASLAFLAPALAQLADEAEALAANARATAEATAALERFNEGFAAYLYGLRMNAFAACFPQVCAPVGIGSML